MDWAAVAQKACDGYRASQRPDELAAALSMIDQLNPEVVVEIGCDTGGTLWAWRQVCERVYGITLADNGYDTGGSGGPLLANGAEVLVGDSHDSATRDWLLRQLHPVNIDARWIDVLVIDGDHTVRGVHDDLDMYGPLVRPGGLILMHDIYSAGDARCEVWKVWPELTQKFRTSEIGSNTGASYGWGVIHVDGD